MTLVRNETQRHSAALKIAGQNPVVLLPLDKFKYMRKFSLEFTGKIFANLLIFYLLFSAVNFLSIKIASQEAGKCNRIMWSST